MSVPKLTPRYWASKRKVLFSEANFTRTRRSRNGATGDCSREFIGSPLTGCARKFNLSRRRTFTVFFSHGNAPMQNIALKVRKVCSRSLSNWMVASCRWPRGNRQFLLRVLPITIQNGSIAFAFLVASAGDASARRKIQKREHSRRYGQAPLRSISGKISRTGWF